MSIIIKSKEINFLIYKYLLEAGLSHSAFTLFNEAQIQGSQQEYESDTKAGHLIHLLEKSLIFSQIEKHATMSEFCECNVDMELIKKHLCTYTKKQQQKIEQEENNVDQGLFDIMQRYENVKSNNISVEENTYMIESEFFNSTFKQINLRKNQDMTLVKLLKNEDKQYLTYYDQDLNLIQNVNLGLTIEQQVQTKQVVPCCIGDSIVQVKKMIWDPTSGTYLMIIFEEGSVLIFDEGTQKIKKMFKLNNISKLIDVKWNKQYQNLVAFIYEDTIEFVNPIIRQTLLSIENEFKMFDWLTYDQIITQNKEGNLIQIRGLQEDLLDYTLEIDQNSENIKVNNKNVFIAVQNKIDNMIRIYTLANQVNPLQIQEEDQIMDYYWGVVNENINNNYIVAIFNQKIKIYDIELASHKYTVVFCEDIIFANVITGSDGSVLVVFTRNEMTLVNFKNQTRHKQVLDVVPKGIQKLSEYDIGYYNDDTYIIINVRNVPL